jgi:hypothetical protein
VPVVSSLRYSKVVALDEFKGRYLVSAVAKDVHWKVQQLTFDYADQWVIGPAVAATTGLQV